MERILIPEKKGESFYWIKEKDVLKLIDKDLKDIEFTKENLEEDENYGEDDEADLIHFHQLEGRRLALEELKKLIGEK